MWGSRHLSHRIPVALSICLAFSGCASEGERKDSDSKYQPITELCNSSISPKAANDAKTIAGSEELYEAEDTPSLGALTKELNSADATGGRVGACEVHRSSASSGPIGFEVEFTRKDSVPQTQPEDPNQWSLHSVGEYARAGHSKNTSWADIYFSCPKGVSSEEYKFITSHIWVPQAAKDTSRSAMVVLNSFSRTLAKELGCEAEAGLSPQVPTPSTS